MKNETHTKDRFGALARLGCCLCIAAILVGVLHAMQIVQPITRMQENRIQKIENTAHVNEITQDTQIQQTFVCQEEELRSFGLKAATYASVKDAILYVTLQEGEGGQVIQQWQIETKTVSDNSLIPCILDMPLEAAKGQTYTLVVSSNADMTNAITLWTNNKGLYEGKLQVSGMPRTDQLILLQNVYYTTTRVNYGYALVICAVCVWGLSFLITKRSRMQLQKKWIRTWRGLQQYRRIMIKIVITEGIILVAAVAGEIMLSRLLPLSAPGWITEWRLVLLFVLASIVAAMVLARQTIAEKPEYLVAVLVLLLGTLYAFGLPAEVFVSWDEAIHYYRALTLSNCIQGEINSAEHAFRIVNGITGNWYHMETLAQAQSDVQQSLLLGQAMVIDATILKKLWIVAYIPSAIGINIGKLLHLPYQYVFLLGGYCNLLLYTAAIYAGIKKLKSGKMIAAVIAMLTTPLFLSVRYGYDFWLFALYFLGSCYFVGHMQSRALIAKRDAYIMLGAFFFGSFAKVVYFPVMALMLLIPLQRWADRKWGVRFRCQVIACMAMLAAGMVLGPFVLPVIWVAAYASCLLGYAIIKRMNRKSRIVVGSVAGLIGVAAVLYVLYGVVPGMLGSGDARGGAVNPGQQLLQILQHPIQYMQTLFGFLTNTYLSYASDAGWISNVGCMAYMGTSSLRFLPAVLLAFVTLTDKSAFDSFERSRIVKISTMVLILLTIAMIATTLYIDFTPLGHETINGCQPRYLLPLFPLFFMLAGPAKIHNVMDKAHYHYVVLSTSVFLAIFSLWQLGLAAYY